MEQCQSIDAILDFKTLHKTTDGNYRGNNDDMMEGRGVGEGGGQREKLEKL